MPEEVLQVPTDFEAKKLVSISPGTRCVLLGVEGIGPSRHSPRRGRQHRWKHSEPDDECDFRHSRKERGRGLMRRLLDLGITKGCTFTVVQGSERGPVLIEVRGTRIALGHHMAYRILVREVP